MSGAMLAPAGPHTKDEDCAPHLVDDACAVCGVLHLDACACGGRGFHRDGCPEIA